MSYGWLKPVGIVRRCFRRAEGQDPLFVDIISSKKLKMWSPADQAIETAMPSDRDSHACTSLKAPPLDAAWNIALCDSAE